MEELKITWKEFVSHVSELINDGEERSEDHIDNSFAVELIQNQLKRGDVDPCARLQCWKHIKLELEGILESSAYATFEQNTIQPKSVSQSDKKIMNSSSNNKMKVTKKINSVPINKLSQKSQEKSTTRNHADYITRQQQRIIRKDPLIVTKRRSKSLVETVRIETKNNRNEVNKTRNNLRKNKIVALVKTKRPTPQSTSTTNTSIKKSNHTRNLTIPTQQQFNGDKNEHMPSIMSPESVSIVQEGKTWTSSSFEKKLSTLLSDYKDYDYDIEAALAILESDGEKIVRALSMKLELQSENEANSKNNVKSSVQKQCEDDDTPSSSISSSSVKTSSQGSKVDQSDIVTKHVNNNDESNRIPFELTTGYGKWKFSMQSSSDFDLDSLYRKTDRYSDQKGVSLLMGTKIKTKAEEVVAILFCKNRFSDKISAQHWWERNDHRFTSIDGKIRGSQYDSLLLKL